MILGDMELFWLIFLTSLTSLIAKPVPPDGTSTIREDVESLADEISTDLNDITQAILLQHQVFPALSASLQTLTSRNESLFREDTQLLNDLEMTMADVIKRLFSEGSDWCASPDLPIISSLVESVLGDLYSNHLERT